MHRFHFPLDHALRYKERRERIEEIRQAQALGEKQKRDAEVERIRRLIDDTAVALQGQMGKPVNLATWFATLNRSEQLGKQMQAAQDEVGRAIVRLQAAQARYRQAAQEAESLRTLRHHAMQEHQTAAARAEQNFLEEIALFRWQNAEDEDTEENAS